MNNSYYFVQKFRPMKKAFFKIYFLVIMLQVIALQLVAQDVLPLGGKWRIALDGNFKDWPNKTGESEGWFNHALPLNADLALLNKIYFKNGKFAVNDYINLPESTDEAGIGQLLQQSPTFTPGLERKISYDGAFWVQREVVIPEEWHGKSVELFLERTLGSSKVFWDNRPAGGDYGFAYPHITLIDTAVVAGTHRLSILINKDDNRYEQTGHQVTNANGTSWNGIVGRIELRAHSKSGSLRQVQIYPQPEKGGVRVKIPIVQGKNQAAKQLRLSVFEPGKAVAYLVKEIPVSEDAVVQFIEFQNTIIEWNEFNPRLYTLKCELLIGGEVVDVQYNKFGMRSLSTEKGYILVNGKRTIMRGTLECGSFPLTGYPAMTAEEWLRIFGVIKEYGLNHVRFHTWCPPEAAFRAADSLGLYLQPELCGRPYAELQRVLETYGNHPSFCMLSLNNEAFSHTTETQKILEEAKNADPRHLYTCTSHPLGIGCTDDFYVSAWGNEQQDEWPFHKKIVGITWGGGDVVHSSRFNTNPPETQSDFQSEIAGINAPVIAHEMGQWAMFPQLSEIETYNDGVLRNTNYERIKDALAERGLADKAALLSLASGKFSALLYKEEIESVLRTPGYAGFQLLGLNDFQGQFISIVGILDDKWQPKGLVDAKKHAQYCNAVVPLLRMPKRVWTNAETFSAAVDVSNVSAKTITNAKLAWTIRDESGKILHKGMMLQRNIPDTGLTHIGELGFRLSKIKKATKLIVQLAILETNYCNEWEIWVYPEQQKLPETDHVFSTHSAAEAKKWLSEGKKVLYLVDSANSKKLRAACFSTIFWNSIHKWPQKAHTMGIVCDAAHPVFSDFPTDSHSNWQWWDITMHARAMVMNDLPQEINPLIGVVDSYIVNDKLSYLWEAKVGNGKLMVCSIDFENDLDERIASKQLYFSLISYLTSDDFEPKEDLDISCIEKLLGDSF